MDLFNIVFIGLILGVGLSIVGLQLHRTRAIKRRLLAHPLRPIAEVAEGPVVVQGYAIPLEPITSPISGTRVVGYRIKVEEHRGTGRNSHWKTLIDHGEINDFEVEDDTGRALVHAAAGQLFFQVEKVQNNGLFKRTPPELVQFLESLGESTEGLIFKKSLRWSEYFLEDGETVCVYGHARRELHAGTAPEGYREAPTRVVIHRPADGPLLISDQHLDAPIRSLGLLADLPPNRDF